MATSILAASKGSPELIAEAERLAKETFCNGTPRILKATFYSVASGLRRTRRTEALAELNLAIELDPNRSDSYLSLARFYIVTNDPAKAEDVFKKAISVNPGSALVHTEYGKYLVQMHRPDKAEAELKEAVEVAPNDRNARFTLAGFYVVNKQLDKAEETLKALADLEKDKPESQAMLADFYSVY